MRHKDENEVEKKEDEEKSLMARTKGEEHQVGAKKRDRIREERGLARGRCIAFHRRSLEEVKGGS